MEDILMYDIGLEMQTSSWKYGKAVCDYAAGSFFNMCEEEGLL